MLTIAFQKESVQGAFVRSETILCLILSPAESYTFKGVAKGGGAVALKKSNVASRKATGVRAIDFLTY